MIGQPRRRRSDLLEESIGERRLQIPGSGAEARLGDLLLVPPNVIGHCCRFQLLARKHGDVDFVSGTRGFGGR